LTWVLSSPPPTLNPIDEQSIYIYRIFSERLTKIERHANATQVAIAMSLSDDGQLRLRIQDDGIGFDPAQVPSDRHGLSAMRERVRVLRGTCTLLSACGEGTSVTISIPFQPFTQ
jgi:signal transduction histidine kinase